MSLPPFLFSPTAPAVGARSPFASTATITTAVSADGGVGAVLDFRQAYMQLTQNKVSLAETGGSLTEDASPLLAKLNLLLDGDLLPEELHESLRSFLDDLQQGVPGQNTESALPILDLLQQADLPQYELSAITAILQEAVDVTMDVQQSPEVVAVLRDLVDLLAGGKTRPVSLPSSAMNLSQEAPAADTDISPVVPPTTFTSEASPPLGNLSGNPKSADLPQTESGKRLEFNQWITAQEELASDPVVKPEWLAGMSKPAGFPADVVLKAETAASPLGAILPPDVEMPESFSVPLAPTSTVPGKGGLIAGLQAPAEAQLHTAMRVQVAFGHAQWSEAVAERAAWLAGQQIHSAELQLDPPELGPLQVRVSVHQDQAVVSFVSANPQVREALDQSMMRLRDLLQEQGMQLVDAGVSDQQRGGEGDNSGAETPEGLTAAATPSESPENDPALSEVMDVRYGVDDFV